jgi:murein DD-endopeptidase MepM/ murein hydrolase activator NlpD
VRLTPNTYVALTGGLAAALGLALHLDAFDSASGVRSATAAATAAGPAGPGGAVAPAARDAEEGAAPAPVLVTPEARAAAATMPRDADAARPALSGTLALTTADSLLEEPYRVGEERRVVEVRSGDTLLAVMARAGVPRGEAHALVAALEEVYDPRDLQVGQELTLVLAHDGYDSRLVGLELMPDVERQVAVVRGAGGGFVAEEEANALETRLVAAGGRIEGSLAASTGAAGVPYRVLDPLIRAFSYSVDFQRDIQPGDAFEMLFERDFHADGAIARDGGVVYARLNLGDRDLAVYRFETGDGAVDYYDRDGQSVRRALLRTPVDGARLSSGYGMRRHPILGYSRMHQGIDFAAAAGTPIFAAGDGTIEVIGRNGGYGNYIRIRHNRTMSTAYGHMRRFASGLSRGSRVQQGDIIGYVGSTGLSTGPHLHYEVHVNGSQVNPLSVDLPVGRTLDGAELATFREAVAERDRRYAALTSTTQVAETPMD